MGFFASAAARSEMKVRDSVLSLLRDARPDFAVGNLLLPCHIISEAHNGFFVDTGAITIGVFRCHLHWWGYELEANALAGLRSPNSAAWMRTVAAVPPTDFGPIRGGANEFAAGLAFGLPDRSAHATFTPAPEMPSPPPTPALTREFSSETSGVLDRSADENWSHVVNEVRKTAEIVIGDTDTQNVAIDGQQVGFSIQITPGMRVRQYWDSDNTYTTAFVVGGRVVDIAATNPPLTPLRATAMFLARILSVLLEALNGAHEQWEGRGEAVAALYPNLSEASGLAALEDDLRRAASHLVSLSLVVRDDGKASRVVLGPQERALLRHYAGSVELGEGLVDLVTVLDQLDRADSHDLIELEPGAHTSLWEQVDPADDDFSRAFPILMVDSVRRYLQDTPFSRDLGDLHDSAANVVGLVFTIAEAGRVWFAATSDGLRISIRAGDQVVRSYELEMPHHFFFYIAEIFDDVCRLLLDLLEGEDSTGVPGPEVGPPAEAVMASLYPSTAPNARQLQIKDELIVYAAVLSVVLEAVHTEENAEEEAMLIDDYANTFRRFARRLQTAGAMNSIPATLLSYGVEL